MRAVVDRIVDEKHVVLLVGEDEVERIVFLEQLPMDVGEGTVLDVDFVEGRLIQVALMEDSSKERILKQMKKLRKNQHSKYKRNE